MNDMVDMSRFIEAKSDQLNADDLIGAPRTITVTRVVGNDGDQPVSIFYKGDGGKPFKPCKTIRRVLMGVWGRYANEYVGKSMTLYRDDKVTFGGLETGGIRISHMSHIDKETIVVVMKSKGKKAGVKILPLKIDAEKPDKPRKTAEEWATDHIAFVTGAADLERLSAVQLSGKAAMDKLGSGPIFERVTKAYARRFAELSAGGDDDPFEPETGRADSDHGDQFDGTDTQ